MSFKIGSIVTGRRARTGESFTGKLIKRHATSRGDWYEVKLENGETRKFRAAELAANGS